jgi:hypothetical protein
MEQDREVVGWAEADDPDERRLVAKEPQRREGQAEAGIATETCQKIIGLR